MKEFKQVFKHCFALPASMLLTLDFVWLASAGNGVGVLLKHAHRSLVPISLSMGFPPLPPPFPLRLPEQEPTSQAPSTGRTARPAAAHALGRAEYTHGAPATCPEHLLLHLYPTAFF